MDSRDKMKFKLLCKQIVEEELSSARERIFARIDRIGNDGNECSSLNCMKLEFRNKVRPVILTGEVIAGEGDHNHIQVVLIDDTTGSVIETGPYASARVEIVLLKGDFDGSGGDHDWTVREFNENIVCETRRTKPFLKGNVVLKLQGGVAVLEDIKFRNDASKMNPPSFRLGARVVDTFQGIRIMEAMTKSFTVKIYRDKYSRKHKIPAPSDDVYRLTNIAKGGSIHKLLEMNGIRTVEDLLIQNLRDPEELKRITGTLAGRKLEATINNAQACPIVKRTYCYIRDQQRAVVFNLLGEALWIYQQSEGAIVDVLPNMKKAEVQDLLASAYEHWEDTSYFVDDDSLHQHLTTKLLLPNCPSSGLVSAGASNAEGECESSNTCATESMFPAENTGDRVETGFGTSEEGLVTNLEASFMIYESERMFPAHDAPLQSQYPFNDEPIYSPCLNCDSMWFNNPSLSAEFAARESEFVDPITRAPKRWKRLFCVSRVSYTIRKKMQRVEH